MKLFQSFFGVFVFVAVLVEPASGQSFEQSLAQLTDTTSEKIDFVAAQAATQSLSGRLSKQFKDGDAADLKKNSDVIYKTVTQMDLKSLHWKQKVNLLMVISKSKGTETLFAKALGEFAKDQNETVRYWAAKSLHAVSQRTKYSKAGQKAIDGLITQFTNTETHEIIRSQLLQTALDIDTDASALAMLKIINQRIDSFTKKPTTALRNEIKYFLQFSKRAAEKKTVSKKVLKEYLRTLTRVVKVCSAASIMKGEFKSTDVSHFKGSAKKCSDWFGTFAAKLKKSAPKVELPDNRHADYIEKFMVNNLGYSSGDLSVDAIEPLKK